MKKNSTVLLLLAVLVLGSVAFWVMKTDSSKGGGKSFSDFEIENTEDITKFVITESTGNVAELSKEGDIWMLNGMFQARPENVDLLLRTFKHIAVQSTVPSELKKTVVANMAARNKKVKIYVNGNLSKTYFVGSPTKDHYGTYMLLEKNGRKSSEPYVMHIPGFNGFLESRFFTNVNDWKYSGVFVYDPLEIAKIEVSFPSKPSDSYVINQLAKIVNLTDQNGVAVSGVNKYLVENYILNFEKIYFNRIAEFEPPQVDSITAHSPVYTISVTDVSNKKKTVDFYLKLSENPTIDLVTGKESLYDTDYIHGHVRGEKEMLVFQYFALGNVFAPRSYFLQQ